MICPECKSEYREGIAKCAECGVALVTSLGGNAESGSGGNSELISIFETTDSALLSDVVARVEEAGVPYLLQTGTAFDYPQVTDQFTWRGVLWIPADETEDVRAMIEEAEKTIVDAVAADEPSTAGESASS